MFVSATINMIHYQKFWLGFATTDTFFSIMIKYFLFHCFTLYLIIPFSIFLRVFLVFGSIAILPTIFQLIFSVF